MGIAERVRELFRPGPGPDPRTPLAEVAFAVLDTELTGLDFKRDAIISVGAVAMTGTAIELGRTFHRLMSPRAPFKAESIVVHGITPDDVSAKPSGEAVLAEFREFCGDRVLAGHFVSLDLRFLARECPAFDAPELRRRAVDTCAIHEWTEEHRHRHAGRTGALLGERSLVALATAWGIPVAGAHNALRDAFITAQLLQRQLRALTGHGVRTLGDLLRVGKP